MGKTTERVSADLRLTLYFFGANSEKSMAKARSKMAYFPSRRDELVSHKAKIAIITAGSQDFGRFRFFNAEMKASVKLVVPTRAQLDVFTDEMK